MLTPHHETTSLAWYLHGVFAPVKWVWWRIVELMFRAQFRLSGDAVPDVPIDIDVFSGGQILNYDHRDLLKSGKIKSIKGSIERCTENGVLLQDGAELDADMIIFGTGYTKSYDMLDALLQAKLEISQDGLYLYRNVIPSRLPDLTGPQKNVTSMSHFCLEIQSH
jgi:dimethylaniline monooxygenase (N-oxide forming)